jgi:glycosyltransferase involved in cell wall biosynthesis
VSCVGDKPGAEADAACPTAAPLRILLVADVRSPTTWGWVDSIRSAGVVVLGVDGLLWPDHRPGSASGNPGPGARQRLRSLAGATPIGLKLVGAIRPVVGLMLAPVKGRRLRRVVRQVKPDVVHGLRIPFEAVVARVACPPSVPLAVSIWGNDLTHLAARSRLTGRVTRRVLERTDLLFADCQRDIDLSAAWGLRSAIPTAVLPGGGGIDLSGLADSDGLAAARLSDRERSSHRFVVNARGARPYVCNDVLLDALALIAADLDPGVRVVFVDSAHDAALRHAVDRHPLQDKIVIMGKRSRPEVLSLFGRAEVSVSITNQDGTPNSLLEAMAAGAIPVCSDLPSIREWIEHGCNGFLAAFNDPQAVASALRLALGLSDAERKAIITKNGLIVAARAERGRAGKQAAEMYHRVLARHDGLAPAARH